MNCKPGDLAVNVGGKPECRGEIYTVIKAYTGPVFKSPYPAWWVEHNGSMFHCLDRDLRPIRDQDGEDEMLRIAGYPHKETA